MHKTLIKTLSLHYHQKEDRMILLLNKNDVDRMVYWITRRFYFTLFFELDTYLDNLGIVDKAPIPQNAALEQQSETSKENVSALKDQNSKSITLKDKEKKFSEDDLFKPYILLENVSISQTHDKQRFKLVFKAGDTLSETIMSKNDFISFYNLMKTSFPRGEWGII